MLLFTLSRNAEKSGHLPRLRWRDLAWVGGIAIIVRLWVLSIGVAQVGVAGIGEPVVDSQGYLAIARHLLGDSTVDVGASVLQWGYGYGVFLAAIFSVCGENPIWVYLIQAFLGGLTAVLVAQITYALCENRGAALCAGLIVALSTSAISLSLLMLSDSLYLFVFALAVYALLYALAHGMMRNFVAVGILMASAAYVRSVGQFWPLVASLAVLLGAYAQDKVSPARIAWRALSLRLGLAIGVAAILMGLWVARNYSIHQLPIFSSTAAGGLILVSATVEEKCSGRPRAEIIGAWEIEYAAAHPKEPYGLSSRVRCFQSIGWRMLRDRPIEFSSVWGSVAWAGVTDVDFLARYVLPKSWDILVPWENWQFRAPQRYFHLIGALLGCVILWLHGRRFASIFCGSIFIYYALMTGFFPNTGSRAFHPALIAWAPLCGVCVAELFRGSGLLWRRVYHVRTPQLVKSNDG